MKMKSGAPLMHAETCINGACCENEQKEFKKNYFYSKERFELPFYIWATDFLLKSTANQLQVSFLLKEAEWF